MFNTAIISYDLYEIEERVLLELNKLFNGEIKEIRSDCLNLEFLFRCIEKVVGKINIPERKGREISTDGFTEYWIWFKVNGKKYIITGKFFNGSLILREAW